MTKRRLTNSNYIMWTIITFVAGFITGALVFRNNAAKAEKVVQGAKDAANKVK